MELEINEKVKDWPERQAHKDWSGMLRHRALAAVMLFLGLLAGFMLARFLGNERTIQFAQLPAAVKEAFGEHGTESDVYKVEREYEDGALQFEIEVRDGVSNVEYEFHPDGTLTEREENWPHPETLQRSHR